jgi:hypothetical protein
VYFVTRKLSVSLCVFVRRFALQHGAVPQRLPSASTTRTFVGSGTQIAAYGLCFHQVGRFDLSSQPCVCSTGCALNWQVLGSSDVGVLEAIRAAWHPGVQQRSRQRELIERGLAALKSFGFLSGCFTGPAP